jgi:hypothetical protein
VRPRLQRLEYLFDDETQGTFRDECDDIIANT